MNNLINEYEALLEKRDSEVDELKIILQEKDEIIHRRSAQNSFHKQNSQSFQNEDSHKKAIDELNAIIASLEESLEISNHQLASTENARDNDARLINQLNIEIRQIQDELEQYRQYYKDNKKGEAVLKKKTEKPKAESQLRPKSKVSDVARDAKKDPKGKSIPFSSAKISSSLGQQRYNSKAEARSQTDPTRNPRE